ncbi:major facilitator superfamily domain-containing protein [Zopfochytrium polystomum]|nr:major facilitator superfamily domain-containing protein [Zopfochytrium polystomum]
MFMTSHSSTSTMEESPIVRRGWSLWLLVASTWWAYFIVNFDGVFAALSAMQLTFNASYSQVTWALNALAIVSTSFYPLWSRLSLAFGDRRCLLASLAFFLVGTVGSAAAPTLPVLCFFRGVMGIGSSGFSALSVVIFTDRVPDRHRPLALNGLGVGMALAMIGGPIVGGALTDAASWRWLFIILIPMSVFIGPLLFLIDNENRDATVSVRETLGGLDVAGAFSLLVASGSVLLAVTFGSGAGWGAPQTLAMFVVAVVFIALFVVNEVYWAANPMMPPFHFKSRSVVASSVLNFFTGGTSMAFMMYVPMLYRLTKRTTFLMSEVHFIPYNLAWALFTVPAVLLLRVVRANHVVSTGTVLLLVGAALFASVIGDEIPSDAAGAVYMAIAGAGAALANQNSIYCAQADLARVADRAIVGNVPVYFHRIGGTVLQQTMSAIVDKSKATHPTFAGQAQQAFYAATAYAGVAVVASLFLRNVPKVAGKPREGEDDAVKV